MVSSVTGEEIDLEILGPYYWVRNLISPVLFTNALNELVSPTDGTSQRNAVDLLIEIGPQSALGGPIEQILAHYHIRNVSYMSMLTRGQSAIDAGLSLGAGLYRYGVSLEVSKANGDTDCRLLMNLPPYAWNYSQEFRADSRI